MKRIRKGSRFGHLVVIERVPPKNRSTPIRRWQLRCDCGAIVERATSALSANCRCHTTCPVSALGGSAGDKFGFLTAIEPTGEKYFYSTIWKFKCVCGNEISRPIGAARTGSKNGNCGCRRTAENGQPLTPVKLVEPGERFGLLTAIIEAPKKIGARYFYCICDCGNETTVRANLLRFGQTKSCGHLSGRVKSKNLIPIAGRHDLESA